MSGLGQKLKWSGACLLALGANVVIQVSTMLGVMIAAAVRVYAQGVTDPEEVVSIVASAVGERLLDVTAIAQVVTIVGFALWYRVLKKRTPDMPVRAAFHGHTWACILALGASLQLFVGLALQVVERMAPSVIAEYEAWMSSTGLVEVKLLSLVTLGVLAPLSEELLFRGVLLHFARRLSRRFWVGNAVQALAFGAWHMNLVQGVYAFFLGLVLGWLRERHGSLWVPVAMHAVFNTVGLVLTGLVQMLLPESPAVYAIAGLLSGVAALSLLRLDGKACDAVEKIRVDKDEVRAYNDP